MTPTEIRLQYERGFNAGLSGHEPAERESVNYMSGFWRGRAVKAEIDGK